MLTPDTVWLPPTAQLLLMEDEETDQVLYDRALKQLRVRPQAYFVSNGQDGLDYLEGKNKFADRSQYPAPTFLIMDIKMPRVTGLDVLKWLYERSEKRFIPTFVLSSSARPQDIQTAYDFGASAYYIKPQSYPELVERLQTIFSMYRHAAFPDLLPSRHAVSPGMMALH